MNWKFPVFARFIGQNIVTGLLSGYKRNWEKQSSDGLYTLLKLLLIPKEVERKDIGGYLAISAVALFGGL